jgi:hypothetical protein
VTKHIIARKIKKGKERDKKHFFSVIEYIAMQRICFYVATKSIPCSICNDCCKKSRWRTFAQIVLA